MDYNPISEHANLIDQTVSFVKEQLANAEAGHDWWHVQRVWTNTKTLWADWEGSERPDPLICELASLLHDVADSKFHGGDERVGPRIAGEFLERVGVQREVIQHVQAIIRHMSYSSSLGESTFHSPELALVQDADRLDALGAIGIARAFHYGGFKNREIFNPAVPPNPGQSKAAYKNSTAPTINHFYEKLLLLKDQMNTAAGKRIAEERHRFLELYLDQFFREWGENPDIFSNYIASKS